MVLIGLHSNAQITSGYSIGIVDGSSFSESTFSNPVAVSSGDCYFVSNTLLKFWKKNNGSFVSNCNSSAEGPLLITDSKYLDFPIKVLPNPFIDFIEIVFLSDVEIKKTYDINIFSTDGKLIFERLNISFKEFKKGHRENLARLSDGIYYLIISSGDFYKSYKIIKK